MIKKGTLYLLPTLLGDSKPGQVLPAGVIRQMHELRLFAAENVRTARRYLIKSELPTPVSQLEFLELNKRSSQDDLMEIVMRLVQGEDLGLLSESGTPCIADPGAALVAKAHEYGISVKPLVGPSSILLGLMGSGFNGQSFSFHGYLPIDSKERDKRIRFLEKLVYREDQTQIFIETPYRNLKMFEALLKVCAADTKISIGIELTTPEEKILTFPVAEWKNMKTPDIHKRNVIFLMYK
jgi:16S rRNA (cytidine1402-2'-O)-methyltransferase